MTMTGHVFYSQNPSGTDKAMPPEQFKQVVEAIVAGKYSWACVLILRFAGDNPLHYIPYTTYNRLLKENCNVKQPLKESEPEAQPIASEGCLSQLQDLTYLELLDQKSSHINGGSCSFTEFLRFAGR
jgi:hypothetical protein